MSCIVVVYHSNFGHTAKQAESVMRGARAVEGVQVLGIKAEEAAKHWNLLDVADAIIFGCPTYMGSASAEFKHFMDATSSRWLKQMWKDKLAAGFTNSGSLSGDKLNTLVQLAIFAAQHSMIWIGLDAMPGSIDSDNGNAVLNRVGGFLGAMAQSDNVSPELSPGKDDLATAARLGKRVAEFVARIE